MYFSTLVLGGYPSRNKKSTYPKKNKSQLLSTQSTQLEKHTQRTVMGVQVCVFCWIGESSTLPVQERKSEDLVQMIFLFKWQCFSRSSR